MLAFQHACRQSDQEVGDVYASFIEEANAIVEQDQKAIEDRLATVEANKVSGCCWKEWLSFFLSIMHQLPRTSCVISSCC